MTKPVEKRHWKDDLNFIKKKGTAIRWLSKENIFLTRFCCHSKGFIPEDEEVLSKYIKDVNVHFANKVVSKLISPLHVITS